LVNLVYTEGAIKLFLKKRKNNLVRLQSKNDKIVPVFTSNALVKVELQHFLFSTPTPERVSSECSSPAALPREKKRDVPTEFEV